MQQEPLLLFIRGLPGSGKSYLSNALVNKLGTDTTVLVDPDAIDENNKEFIIFSENLSKEGLDVKIHPFRWLRKTACEGISAGKIVIWNQPFTDRGVFDRLIIFIQENSIFNDSLKIVIAELDIDEITAKKRIQQRIYEGGHGPSNATFERRKVEYTSFDDRYKTIKLDGTGNVDQSVSKLVGAIKSH